MKFFFSTPLEDVERKRKVLPEVYLTFILNHFLCLSEALLSHYIVWFPFLKHLASKILGTNKTYNILIAAIVYYCTSFLFHISHITILSQ